MILSLILYYVYRSIQLKCSKQKIYDLVHFYNGTISQKFYTRCINFLLYKHINVMCCVNKYILTLINREKTC
jgi:hypothetical protein